MQYKVKILENDEGFAIWCEDLPGCASQGDTEEEAIENIRDAISEYLEMQKELTKDEKLILLEI